MRTRLFGTLLLLFTIILLSTACASTNTETKKTSSGRNSSEGVIPTEPVNNSGNINSKEIKQSRQSYISFLFRIISKLIKNQGISYHLKKIIKILAD